MSFVTERRISEEEFSYKILPYIILSNILMNSEHDLIEEGRKLRAEFEQFSRRFEFDKGCG